MCRKNRFSHQNVFANLLGEFLRSREFPFTPEKFQEVNLDGLSIYIIIKIENMRLRHQLILSESRVIPNIEDTPITAASTDHLRYVNTMFRHKIFVVEFQVGCWKTNNLAASLLAHLNRATDLIISTQ